MTHLTDGSCRRKIGLKIRISKGKVTCRRENGRSMVIYIIYVPYMPIFPNRRVTYQDILFTGNLPPLLKRYLLALKTPFCLKYRQLLVIFLG